MVVIGEASLAGDFERMISTVDGLSDPETEEEEALHAYLVPNRALARSLALRSLGDKKGAEEELDRYGEAVTPWPDLVDMYKVMKKGNTLTAADVEVMSADAQMLFRMNHSLVAAAEAMSEAGRLRLAGSESDAQGKIKGSAVSDRRGAPRR